LGFAQDDDGVWGSAPLGEKNMNINGQAFLDSLIYMGIGMLGIFLIISLLVVLLNVFSKLFPAGEEDE
jgi:hypothetical protein